MTDLPKLRAALILRLIEHEPSHFTVPPAAGPRFTLVEVMMF